MILTSLEDRVLSKQTNPQGYVRFRKVDGTSITSIGRYSIENAVTVGDWERIEMEGGGGVAGVSLSFELGGHL